MASFASSVFIYLFVLLSQPFRCGHCKNLVPEYKKAAKALKGIVKIGAVDMTQHESLGQPYGVTGFPTIKVGDYSLILRY